MKIFFATLLPFALFISCKQENKNLVKMEGEAQGTTYHISYISTNHTNYQPAIDSLFKNIDSSLSTYLPVSIISRINKNDSTVLIDGYFEEVFNKSNEISKKTAGAFDVTVGRLINAYGFGPTKKTSIDSTIIDSLKAFTNYQMVSLKNGKLVKQKPEILLDFNAIAQGYSVDILCNYLDSKGISNYLVEIGGELKAKGKKQGEYWKVGVDKPTENRNEEGSFEAVIQLNNKALCTSGNYRKFYTENGRKYAHIIDPRTGYQAKQNILSASVLANDAATADAYATAFMVMGLGKSKQFLLENKELGLEVYFIYEDNGTWKTYTSESLKKWIKELN